jgi:hypothetical protein
MLHEHEPEYGNEPNHENQHDKKWALMFLIILSVIFSHAV